jgi:hypothetical protein
LPAMCGQSVARRFGAPAVQRCGERLKEIPPAANHHDAATRAQEGALPRTRSDAAAEAGLSERQRKTALRVANVAKDSPRKMEWSTIIIIALVVAAVIFAAVAYRDWRQGR